MTDTDTDETYEFPPRSTRGIVLGIGGAKLAYLGAALVLLAFSLYLSDWRLTLAALVIGVGLVTFGWVSVGGRTLATWSPIVAGHLWRRTRSWFSYRGGIFAPDSLQLHLDLPGDLAGCRMVEAVAKDGVSRVGLMLDENANTVTAALLSAGSSIVLEESSAQVAKLDDLQGIIDSFADAESGIGRWQLMMRGLPDTTNGAQRHYAAHVTDHDTIAAENLRQLNATSAPMAQQHEVFVCVQFNVGTLRGEIKDAGGGDAGLGAVIVDRLAEIEASIEEADITSYGWLTPSHYAAVIRTQFDPEEIELYDLYAAPGDTALDPRLAGPGAAEPNWSSYRVDSGVHKTVWVHQLPRRKVRRNWLSAVLQHHGVRRTVTLVSEPLSAERVAAMLKREQIEGQANSYLRERHGLIESASTRKENRSVEQQDNEVAEGATAHRFHMFVTVTGTDEAEARQSLRAVRRRLTRVHCQSVQLYGEQDQGFFAAALPLCRGLAPIRGRMSA